MRFISFFQLCPILCAACAAACASAGNDDEGEIAERNSFDDDPSLLDENPEEAVDEGDASYRLELAWSTARTTYGQETPSLFVFSEDSARLAVSGNVYTPLTEILNARGGQTLISESTSLQAAIRDSAWRVELRSGYWHSGTGAFEVVELSSGRVLLTSASSAQGVALSADGSRVATYRCEPTGAFIEVRSVSGEELSRHDLGSACDEWLRVPMDMTPKATHVAFAPPGQSRLFLLDVASGALSSTPVIDETLPQAPTYDGPVLSVRVAPDGRSVGVTGTDGRFQSLELPSLSQAGAVWDAGWAGAFEYCYCPTITASPIAWWPDATLVATLAADRTVTVRRASNATLLAQVRPERRNVTLSREDSYGALHLAVSPDGTLLAVGLQDRIEAYRLVSAPAP